MSSKLWVSGDSFVDLHRDNSWSNQLKNSWMYGSDMTYVNGVGGLDADTILDNILINLHNIKDGDLVILYIPTMWRHRLPLKKEHWDDYIQNTYKKEVITKDCISLGETLSGFVHGNYLNMHRKNLELPFSLNDSVLHSKREGDMWPESNNIIKHHFKDCIDFVRCATSSDSSIDRIQRILNSIVSAFPKVNWEIFTWADEFNSPLIKDRDWIKQNIGEYETNNDVWIRTNGKEGELGDIHFSRHMNNVFSDFIKNKYLKLFRND